ncbi:MAG TPA: gluconate 2-dehydrogenase subunit 3 family protein [Flavitalea sp.]|nr:gluconate 2-dehydrogenase subunit 3 family protein [Flavitalea sp.]
MDRRQALSRVGLLLGGTVIGASYFLEGCKPEGKKLTSVNDFSAEDIAYLDEVADTILPTTASSPGAKAAKVGAFMTVMVRDCYTEKQQKTFMEGMSKLNDASKKKFDKVYMEITPDQRTELLNELDKEQKAFTAKQTKDETEKDPHYFRMMKELTLLGYFTSEIGATKALRYVESPGKYDGNYDYKKGDKAWAI